MNKADKTLNDKLNDIAATKETAAELKKTKLNLYIDFGMKQAELSKKTSSTKELGKELKKRFPACEKMDAALRSNCGWLAEALHNPQHEAHDLLEVLGIKSIHELGYENPTTIRRLYRKAKEKPTP